MQPRVTHPPTGRVTSTRSVIHLRLTLPPAGNVSNKAAFSVESLAIYQCTRCPIEQAWDCAASCHVFPALQFITSTSQAVCSQPPTCFSLLLLSTLNLPQKCSDVRLHLTGILLLRSLGLDFLLPCHEYHTHSPGLCCLVTRKKDILKEIYDNT